MQTRQEMMIAYSAAFPDRVASTAVHRAYYAQFVTPTVRDSVAQMIGHDKLRASTNEHLNDIPLARWDSIAPMFNTRALAQANGTGGVSLSDCICVAKEAARQWIESQVQA